MFWPAKNAHLTCKLHVMLNDYFRMILRRWWLVLLPVAGLAIVTIITYRVPATSYTVTMRFSVGLAPEQTSNAYGYDRYYTWLSSEYMANGFAGVARTSLFAQNVAGRVNAQGMSVTPGQIEAAISSDKSQSIMVIYLSWPDATQAVKIADAIGAEFSEHGTAYWPQITASASTPLIQLDKPVAIPGAMSLRDRFDLPIRILIALACGLALALIAHFIDPYVRERQELERMGFDIIVEIPLTE